MPLVMSQLSRRFTPITLFFLSINGIIGSGWLFAPMYAAKMAGPAAILSWVIGGFAVMMIAFTFAEISTMMPVAGGTAHIPQLSHGKLASFILSWVAWVTAIVMAPIEVMAVLQYATLFFPALMTDVGTASQLSLLGYLWAGILFLSLSIINVISYQGLVRFNFILMVFKLGVIFITVFAIMHAAYHPQNFSGLLGHTTTKAGWQGILGAVAMGGVIFAFNGFKNGVDLAGEAKNLAIAIPLSTVGSVLACLAVFLLLQVAFIGAISPDSISNGWSHLSFAGDEGPFVGLAVGLGLTWLLSLLYVNAVVSPLGAGLIYVTSTARILFAMSKMGYVPKFLSYLNKRHFPIWAIAVNFFLGMLAFLPLPGWQEMMNFLVSAMVITYAMGPIAVLCLRYSMPERKREFKIPMANVICVFAFYCCNLINYWTGWATISKLGIMLLIGLVIFTFSYLRGYVKLESKDIKPAVWIIPYLGGLVLLSYLGSFGGIGLITFGWDFLVIGVFSILVMICAVQSHLQINVSDIEEYVSKQSFVLEHA